MDSAVGDWGMGAVEGGSGEEGRGETTAVEGREGLEGGVRLGDHVAGDRGEASPHLRGVGSEEGEEEDK